MTYTIAATGVGDILRLTRVFSYPNDGILKQSNYEFCESIFFFKWVQSGKKHDIYIYTFDSIPLYFIHLTSQVSYFKEIIFSLTKITKIEQNCAAFNKGCNIYHLYIYIILILELNPQKMKHICIGSISLKMLIPKQRR